MKRKRPPPVAASEAAETEAEALGQVMRSSRRAQIRRPRKMAFIFILALIQAKAARAAELPKVPNDCLSSPFEEGLALMCSLSAINSAEEKTNFSVIPNQHTLSLTVKCRDPTLSQLEPEGFRSLRFLRKLTLDGCHLRSLPSRAFAGLDRLTSLVVKTRNAGVLDVASDAFKGLANLEHLDLSGNFIRFLPPKSLCPLANLLSLDLSANEIGTVADLGKNLECVRNLKSLDLSHNAMSTLDGGLNLGLPKLQELKLAHNRISTLKPDVLAKKPDLRFIDLSNNRLTSLAESTFEGNPELNRISLSNNSLSFLPLALFQAQNRSLEVLDLSGNVLSSFNGNVITGLVNLNSLDLSNNDISYIDSANTLRSLNSLQSLKLNRNKLQRLPILNLPALRSLSLSENRLRGRLAPSRLFTKLPLLSHLLLDSNQIEELPRQIFVNSTRLTVLDLSHNRLRGDIPTAINALQSLQSLALSHNQIATLSQLQLSTLWRLQASGNLLTNISSDQLTGLPALQVLDLSNNQITDVQKGAFEANKPLQAIRLDKNRLKRMDNLFQDLPNLLWLNISANQISVFDFAMVPKTLQWLDVHQNQITGLENYFGTENEHNLAHLDASFNQLRELGPQNVPNSVKTLLVNDNKIETLVPYTFFKKTQLLKVDLSVNKLESIDRNALRLSSSLTDGVISTTSSPDSMDKVERPKFYFGGNPILCDCHMAWFKTINTDDTVSSILNFPMVADLESIYCQLLYSRQLSYVPLVEAKTEDFLCTYKTHCFALCHCCDYDACDCEMTCPDNCTCYHDTTWTKNIAECSSADFTDLPDQLPMDATEIFLDGNNIGDLHSHTFIGRKNLRVLYLNNSLLASVENHTFNGLSVLEQLHLEDNSIGELQGDEFHGLTLLRELYLHNNQIKSVNNVTFLALKSLKTLSLSGNQIVNFPVWEFSKNPVLAWLDLANNPWSCECEFREQFRLWLAKDRELEVVDAEAITCQLTIGAEEPPPGQAALTSTRILDADLSKGCQVSTGHIQQKDLSLSSSLNPLSADKAAIFQDFLPIFLGVLSAVILLMVAFIGIFVYRDEMRVWLYSKYGIRFFHRIDGVADFDLDKIFDGFVAYSAKDESFVRQVLAPELELNDHHLDHSSQQYKLCLFYRDLPIQNSYHLADTIVQATEASRRTIVVLSEHFVKGEWSRYDFKSGMHQALRSVNRRGKQLIVILLGDIASRRDLDPDLRLYLKSGIVLQWGDKLFWQKLRYALPDTQQRNRRILPYTHHHMSAFSPDTESFRYETYHHPRSSTTNNTNTAMANTTSRSLGGTSSTTYQSVGTPDEQDSTRTMTIHI